MPNYALYGFFGGASAKTAISMKPNPGNTSEYYVQGVTLYENDVFLIHMIGERIYTYKDVKTSIPKGLVKEHSGDGYIQVIATGIYDIYSSYDKTDDGYVYLTKVGEVGPSTVHVTGITLSRSGFYVGVNKMFYLEATISPSNAANQEFAWTYDSTKVIVSETGWVYGVSVGKTTVKVTSKDGGYEASCTVFVGESETPPFYLIGKIGGDAVEIGDCTYAAYPDTGSYYRISDVKLCAGDEIHIYNPHPDANRPLKDSMGRVYTFNVAADRFGDLRMDILSPAKAYLTFAD